MFNVKVFNNNYDTVTISRYNLSDALSTAKIALETNKDNYLSEIYDEYNNKIRSIDRNTSDEFEYTSPENLYLKDKDGNLFKCKDKKEALSALADHTREFELVEVNELPKELKGYKPGIVFHTAYFSYHIKKQSLVILDKVIYAKNDRLMPCEKGIYLSKIHKTNSDNCFRISVIFTKEYQDILFDYTFKRLKELNVDDFYNDFTFGSKTVYVEKSI